MKNSNKHQEKFKPASDYERAYIYQTFHRDFQDRFNATRRIEWIINGALWGGIILIAGKIAGHVDFQNWTWLRIITISLVMGIFHFVFWMYPIQCSENRDGDLARYYRLRSHYALKGLDRNIQNNSENLKDEIEKISKEIVDTSDNNFYTFLHLGKMVWPVIECLVTPVLSFTAMSFLKLVPWCQ